MIGDLSGQRVDYRALATAPVDAQLRALEGFVRADEDLMLLLAAIRDCHLPDGWLVSGAIYQSLWNRICRFPARTGIKDYDVIYFDDRDISFEAEDRVIRLVERRVAGSGLAVEVRNQARVHLWFEKRFGFVVPPLTNSAESLTRYASTTHAVAARLTADGAMEFLAPYGLRDIFAMHLRPNRLLPNAESHNDKARRFKAIWPDLTVEWW